MDRINHASAEADKFGAGKDGFTDGDPVDPSSGTIVNEDFLDGVQEELIGLLERAGLTPSNADYTQLGDALLALVSGVYPATGGIKFDTLTDTEPRVYDDNNPDDERYLIGRFGASTTRIHVYLVSYGAIDLAYNVYWETGTGWVSTGSNHGLITLAPWGASAGQSITFQNTLVSNAFTKEFTLQCDPELIPATANANTLYAAATTKVSGWVQFDSAAQGTFDKFNIGIADATASTSIMTITFDQAFTDFEDLAVQVTSADLTRFRNFAADMNGASNCFVVARDDAGAVINPQANNIRFFIEVKGPQA